MIISILDVIHLRSVENGLAAGLVNKFVKSISLFSPPSPPPPPLLKLEQVLLQREVTSALLSPCLVVWFSSIGKLCGYRVPDSFALGFFIITRRFAELHPMVSLGFLASLLPWIYSRRESEIGTASSSDNRIRLQLSVKEENKKC